jgi:hypothetical protein
MCLGRTKAEKIFVREGERLLYVTQDIDDWLFDQRVSVKRVPGMHAWSSQWTLEQVVEHTITVGLGIQNTLRTLCLGSSPQCDARVVDQTPLGGQGPGIRKHLQNFLTRFEREFEGMSFQLEASTMHPWFGKLNAAQWYRLAALSNLLHRVHAERIFEQLPHTNLCD